MFYYNNKTIIVNGQQQKYSKIRHFSKEPAGRLGNQKVQNRQQQAVFLLPDRKTGRKKAENIETHRKIAYLR